MRRGGARRSKTETRRKWLYSLLVRPTTLQCISTSHMMPLLPPWRPWATLRRYQKLTSSPPPSSPREGGGGYGPGDHDPDLKDQICEHIPSQAPTSLGAHLALLQHLLTTGSCQRPHCHRSKPPSYRSRTCSAAASSRPMSPTSSSSFSASFSSFCSIFFSHMWFHTEYTHAGYLAKPYD